MKTQAIFLILTLAIAISAFSQKATLELTFTAEDNGQYVPLDSILIENLTQGGDTSLYAPDTLLVLDYITSISDQETIGENTFYVSQNRPNPFYEKTEVNLYLPQKENIKISIRDLLGRELAQYANILSQGNHSFVFYAGNEKYYLLTATGKQTSKTIKMLNANTNTVYAGKCKIIYIGYEDNMIDYKSQEAINNFGFSIGDELKYTCYSDIGERTIINLPSGNQTYTFHYAGNPCPGMPTITDIDGNIYNTVQIGDQCWMAENLKTTIYQNGTSIPNITDPDEWQYLTTAAYVWLDNDISWKGLYGALYNWYAIDDANSLCPTGWHVPTNDEWTDLTDYIGGANSPHGNELKSCRQVNSPLGGGCNTTVHPRWNEHNTHGTDNYGFSGLPGGIRDYYGSFYWVGMSGIWWSSTSNYIASAWCRVLDFNDDNVFVSEFNKRDGYSIRCLKD